jgi:hypothetical protein
MSSKFIAVDWVPLIFLFETAVIVTIFPARGEREEFDKSGAEGGFGVNGSEDDRGPEE